MLKGCCGCLPPVFIGEEALQWELLEREEPAVAQELQELIHLSGCARKLVDPIHMEEVIFPSLPDWVIEPEVAPGLENTSCPREQGILSLYMAHRIRRIARELKIEVVVAERKLLPINYWGERLYCVARKRVDVLSEEETISMIANMGRWEQMKLAATLVLLIRKSGFAAASFTTIRLNREKKIVILTPLPLALMVPVKQPPFFNPRGPSQVGMSIEKSAALGLRLLLHKSSVAGVGASSLSGLEVFWDELFLYYNIPGRIEALAATLAGVSRDEVLRVPCPLIEGANTRDSGLLVHFTENASTSFFESSNFSIYQRRVGEKMRIKQEPSALSSIEPEGAKVEKALSRSAIKEKLARRVAMAKATAVALSGIEPEKVKAKKALKRPVTSAPSSLK